MTLKEKIPVELKFSLASLRVRMGLNQEEAAKLLGVSRDTLRSYERDSSKLEYDFIQKVEEVYNIPLDYIFLEEYRFKR